MPLPADEPVAVPVESLQPEAPPTSTIPKSDGPMSRLSLVVSPVVNLYAVCVTLGFPS